MRKVIQRYSENIAGVLSMVGNLSLLAAGTPQSIVSTAIFISAALIMTRYGNRSLGYSISALTFAIGDITLMIAPSMITGSFLWWMIAGMTGAWLIGALLYPLRRLNLTAYRYCAGLCSSLNILFKLPGFTAAIYGGQYIIACALFCWLVSDVFAGRLQYIRFRLS